MQYEEPYLLQLGFRLAMGIQNFPTQWKAKHIEFIHGFQQADGGYRGREGGSDLYYTAFAVRSLAMLEGFTNHSADKLVGYLKSHTESELNIIDLVSWLYSAIMLQLVTGEDLFNNAEQNWQHAIAQSLESVRTDDGGYGKNSESTSGSTYQSFLIALTYELMQIPVPRPNSLIQFLYDRQRDDGGFVEIAPMKRSGTNPTAAAVAVLLMFDQIDDEIIHDVRDFFLEVYSPDGGFLANSRIPFADGLSTFTGLLTALDLDLSTFIDKSKMKQFVEKTLELPAGGFRGAIWDEQADVEYTFYGLGILALLNS